jgi:hypothetical protein
MKSAQRMVADAADGSFPTDAFGARNALKAEPSKWNGKNGRVLARH